MNRCLLLTVLLMLIGACARQTLEPVQIDVPTHRIHYLDEVKPILVKRCVVCHSCYNSPCQLKLSSFAGLDRGATKKRVYDSERLQTMEPTRLFLDAGSTQEWQEKKGFFSVTAGNCTGGSSLMLQLLGAKNKTPIRHLDVYNAEADDLTCAENEAELGSFLAKHPNRGMPFGFPPLSKGEFQVIGGWLMQGAHGPEGAQLQALMLVPAADQAMIDKWEKMLNNPAAKHVMTARYLFEHLFLAHISFNTGTGNYYELVRSATPPGQALAVIGTELPYDKPTTTPFYYRFRKIHSTIVHKTHMVYPMDDAKYARIEDLFLKRPWLDEPVMVSGYAQQVAANPFRAFAQIPPRSRYEFLLDDINYIIMTFIRGPVCKGQVALNVVRDQFWVLFLAPDYDLSVRFPGFLQTNSRLLEMPTMAKNDLKRAKSLAFSHEYRRKATEYMKKRQEFYENFYRYNEVGANAIWRGRKKDDSPLLTVFRHFDSASVHRGPLGNLPRTVWVMDYPLVERIYYSLVAGFNVYGTALHQVAIRIYMDELRQEGETYFLDFMPKEQREPMMRDWYGGLDLKDPKINYTPSALVPGFQFTGKDPQREFIEHLVDSYFPANLGLHFDENYLRADQSYPEIPATFTDYASYVQGFQAVSRPGTAFFAMVADHNANLAYIRIKVNDNETDDVYLSAVVNRWHNDVTTLFGEEQRLSPEKDSAVFIKNFVGSYPNYFFEVDLADVPDFLHALRDYNKDDASRKRLGKYGVNRADPRFWEVYDRFQARFDKQKDVYPGVLDLNRYYHLALVPEL